MCGFGLSEFHLVSELRNHVGTIWQASSTEKATQIILYIILQIGKALEVTVVN